MISRTKWTHLIATDAFTTASAWARFVPWVSREVALVVGRSGWYFTDIQIPLNYSLAAFLLQTCSFSDDVSDTDGFMADLEAYEAKYVGGLLLKFV